MTSFKEKRKMNQNQYHENIRLIINRNLLNFFNTKLILNSAKTKRRVLRRVKKLLFHTSSRTRNVAVT